MPVLCLSSPCLVEAAAEASLGCVEEVDPWNGDMPAGPYCATRSANTISHSLELLTHDKISPNKLVEINFGNTEQQNKDGITAPGGLRLM